MRPRIKFKRRPPGCQRLGPAAEFDDDDDEYQTKSTTTNRLRTSSTRCRQLALALALGAIVLIVENCCLSAQANQQASFPTPQDATTNPKHFHSRPTRALNQPHLAEAGQDQNSNSFGSRLLASASSRSDSGEPAEGDAREDTPLAEATGQQQQPDPDKLFMNRQGQMGNEQQAAGEPNRLRQARQPAPPPQGPSRGPGPNPNLMMQQQQQQRARQQQLAGVPPSGLGGPPSPPAGQQVNPNGQERFQRLRSQQGNSFEQFPRPQQQQQPGTNFAPSLQQAGNQGAPTRQQVALGLPTLSAFDLSSLANLANNQPGGQAGPNQQLGAPTFRRLPPQQSVQLPPPGQQQNARANNQQNPFALGSQFFESNLRANQQQQQQVPNSQNGAGNQPTELPFIRQVFRPAPPGGERDERLESANNNNLLAGGDLAGQLRGGRPTPPPLFVPSRQQVGTRGRPLESGFSPITPNRAPPSSDAATPFFEPNLRSQQQQGQRSQLAGRQQQQQQQPAGQPVPAGTPQASGPAEQPQQRRAPVRRPSQRPHVPASAQAGPIAGRVGVNGGSAAPEAIRLASNAIRAANEGLAVVSSQAAPQQPPNNFESSISASNGPSSSTTQATTTSGAASSTTQANAAGEPQQTTTTSAELQSSGRRAASSPQPPVPPMRTSANFFATLTSAATSSPSSFSPALPINQAIAATGGRRRIPVRNGPAGGRGGPQTTTPAFAPTQPTTTSSTITAAAATTTAGTTRASGTSAATSAAVRRPEIEEFYETIGAAAAGGGVGGLGGPLAGGSSPTTTLIDGFGAPARPRTTETSSTPSSPSQSTTSSPPEVTSDRSAATTTDLYGSRLAPGSSRGGGGDETASSPSEPAADRPRPQRPLAPPPQLEAQPAAGETPNEQLPAQQAPNLQQQQQQPVMVPVTYMTTLTYLTTVLHGTHTLETSHEALEKSTKMATLNAQLMDQIEHKLPLIEPTATVSLSSRTKGRGTTLVNLKSAISAYNQELVEALGAAAGAIQPTQVVGQVAASSTVALPPQQQQVQQLPFNRQRTKQQQEARQKQRPSRTVDLKELAELPKQVVTEYVYSYTMRPVEAPEQLLATSVRSELVPGASMAEPLMASQLLGSQAAESNLIDSNGMMRLELPEGNVPAQINLGSTVGRNTPQTMTEVNMNVNTYLKFEGISNVLVDLRPTAVRGTSEPAEPAPQPFPASGLSAKSQLETSFNVHMTLGNALEQLSPRDQQAVAFASQQTPALGANGVQAGPQAEAGQQPAGRISETSASAQGDLLRSSSAAPQSPASAVGSTAAAAAAMAAAAGAAVAVASESGVGSQQQQQVAAAAVSSSSSSSSLARSQLRSRVASSRFRTLQPSRAVSATASLSPSLTSAAAGVGASLSPAASETATPPLGQAAAAATTLRGLRPSKSRISRPSLVRATSQLAANEISSSELAAAASTSATSPAASPTRSSKPRFVVVTRTGQFGIRASAISSLAAQASSSSSSLAPEVEPSSTAQVAPVPPPSSPTVRVSSRFSKPNRFRGAASQTITRLPADQVPASATSLVPQAAATPTSAGSSPSSQSVVPPSGSNSARPEEAAQPMGAQEGNRPGDQDNRPALKLGDGSESVVVTYFTTTTHTIPFELNSETVFTTLEETNSRIATEFMSDLSSHFIEPTPTASLPTIQQTAAPSLPGSSSTASPTALGGSSSQSEQTATTTTSSTTPQTTTSSGTTDPTTSGQPQQTGGGEQQTNKPVIDPSFVTTLNTRTYFTTFTYFTTYSAGSDSQTVKSSESTTSNVVTETITSTLPASSSDEFSTSVGPSTSSVDGLPAGTTSAVLQADLSSTVAPSELITRTLLSTMTYYGTVYNGTQTSLTPILDVSTQVLTLSASLGTSPGFTYLNSDLLSGGGGGGGPTSVASQPEVAATSAPAGESSSSTTMLRVEPSVSPTPPLGDNSADKITRTKSMYTTLTHFITFYSGTKTQLSTIQEISPTVVTEYIDRTLFEQQQAEASAAASSSVLLVVPTASSDLGSSPASSAPPPTTTTSSATTEAPAATTTTSAGESSSSSEQPTTQGSSTTSTTTSSTTTTSQPAELGAVSVSSPERPASENQQAGSGEGKVLASSGSGGGATDQQDLSVESKQATNIIELSDLIASNSSQSGRVALAGNLGAAIKDIVQLLAGNKTAPGGGGGGADGAPRPPVNLENLPASTTGEMASSAESSASTTASTSSPPTSPHKRPNGAPTRLFGNKQRVNSELHGSMSSPPGSSTTTTSTSHASTTQFDDQTTTSSRPTPELHLSGRDSAASSSASSSSSSSQQPNRQQQQQQAAAATIFFGDDSQDERKKQIKTVWQGAQSTQFVTSIEPSTRSLTLTTTRVYYTRDAPLTITSSYTSVIAPRTFVSTIVGTRTLVNQLNGPSSTALPAAVTPVAPTSSASAQNNAKQAPPRAADTQNAAVATRYKQQKQQQQQVAQEQKKLNQQQLAAKQAQQQAQLAAARMKLEQQQQAMANINQCQPACRQNQNEICKFTPALEQNGAQGTFACACRPGFYMSLNSVGQRSCQEVQSYVIMLRLLQIGDQQVAYKRELQNRSSPEFKQFSKIVREHVKRAYMTSDLVRDRYVGSEILNYARTLSVSSGTSSQSMGAVPSSGRSPVAINSSQLDPLNAGLIVNMTIHLQAQPGGASSSSSSSSSSGESASGQVVDEATLKEELTKKLNMRQAAALAAAAAAASHAGSDSALAGNSSSTAAGQQQQQQADQPQQDKQPASGSGGMGATSANNQTASATTATQEASQEMLPNPNALFLADVEHVQDLDECANPALNDCHEGAVCLNEPGSYKCDCREYPDLNPLQPGRQCANELKSCDFCNNRGDCLRVPSLFSPTGSTNSSSTTTTTNGQLSSPQPGNGRGASFSTVCQCQRLFMGRYCEINGLLLATLLPIVAILLIISVSLIFFCCRRWRRRSSLSKGFRNIGTFGPNMIGGTLDRKAMLESSSESSDTHQRAHHHNHHNGAAGGHQTNMAAHQLHHHPGAHLLRPGGGGPSSGLYDASEPSSSQESSPRQISRGGNEGALTSSANSYLQHLSPAAAAAVAAGGVPPQASSLNPYCSSIPPQIVIPRARHNQVNYAVHRGQVYMW